ncbi:MAG: bifunctional 3-demethylubiquinol 3-O-methyltransferase/2-polyprenyl-6-hydroxyphenol methylase, partial [Pseudomonadota bacterium]
GGIQVTSTINRNPKSYVLAIFGAERVMRWLPVGTHDWSKFITPGELTDMLSTAGLRPVDRSGFVFDPVGWRWRLSDRDLSVNYVIAAVKG